ncbi:hypothetical protein L6R52_41305, partial [Myxococcota bacterium]|nr:hypothetical protein [Myxococcota bacterium]
MIVVGSLALAATFAAVLLFARAVLHVAGEPRWTVASALAVMLFTCGAISICRVTEDLVVATVITAALAVLGVAALWRVAPVAAPVDVPAVRPHRWAIAAGALILGLTAWAAILNFLWDEYSGHFPLAAAVSRGVAPAEHPFFPGAPFHYHYAYDILAGQVRAFTGIPVAYALDVATIASMALLLPCAAAVGGRLAGRLGASLAIVLVPLGSSITQYLLLPELGALEVRWAAIPASWLDSVPPPIISNFFQHPQGFAMPIVLAIALLFDGRDTSPRGRLARVAVGALLLGLASLAQLVFFLVLGLALGASVLARALVLRRWRAVPVELVLLASALVVAR